MCRKFGRFVLTNVATFGVVLLCFPATADTIYFSGQSSDSTPFEVLDAHIVWSFNAGTNQLTMDIFNDTTIPDVYTLSLLQFNTSTDVAGFSVASHALYDNADSLVVPSGLTPSVGPGSDAGGFGSFDWAVDFGIDNTGITEGHRLSIVFDVTANGVAILDMSDFFNPPAVRGQEETGVAVMHFTRGPEEDSAWGIPGPVIPEPATVMLLGMGAAALAVRQMRIRRN